MPNREVECRTKSSHSRAGGLHNNSGPPRDTGLDPKRQNRASLTVPHAGDTST